MDLTDLSASIKQKQKNQHALCIQSGKFKRGGKRQKRSVLYTGIVASHSQSLSSVRVCNNKLQKIKNKKKLPAMQHNSIPKVQPGDRPAR